MGDARPDREAIIGLTLAYCSALDAGRYDRLRAVFTPDATAHLGGSGQVGLDQIIERVSSALAGFDRCEHHLTDHRVDVAGDAATARCSVRALHLRPPGETPPVYTVAGAYEDRLVRTDDGWRISHRDLVVEWRDGERAAE